MSAIGCEASAPGPRRPRRYCAAADATDPRGAAGPVRHRRRRRPGGRRRPRAVAHHALPRSTPCPSSGRARSWFCRRWSASQPPLWPSSRLRLGPSRPGFDLRVGLAAIAAVLALYAVTAIVHDEPEGPATTLVAALVVLIACWLGGGRAGARLRTCRGDRRPAGRGRDRRVRAGGVRPFERLPARRPVVVAGALFRLRLRRRPPRRARRRPAGRSGPSTGSIAVSSQAPDREQEFGPPGPKLRRVDP